MWVSDGGGQARWCSGGLNTRTASSVSNMEFGKVERALSKKLNSTVVVYKSKTKPGYDRFNHKKGDEYVCCRCRELGKYRAIRLRNDVVVGRKDPETHISSAPT